MCDLCFRTQHSDFWYSWELICYPDVTAVNIADYDASENSYKFKNVILKVHNNSKNFEVIILNKQKSSELSNLNNLSKSV